MDFDTLNKYMVAGTVLGDPDAPVVRIMRPPARTDPVTKHDGLVLAAWLVAMLDHSEGHADFLQALAQVEST